MKNLFPRLVPALLAICTLQSALSTGQAQGTAFTYQGLLNVSNSPASGGYDLTFSLFNNSNGASGQTGLTQTNLNVDVSNGLFTVTLNFGAGIFTGSNYWVEIAARTNGSSTFTNLSPLLPITPAPYAISAGTATALTGTVSNGSISGTYTSAVNFSNSSNVFAGNGAGLTNLANVWNLTGNAGATPGAQFLGTTDTNALELRVNGVRAMRCEPGANGPNVIGGSSNNSVVPGVFLATIGGGDANSIGTSAIQATIGGGESNTIKAYSLGSIIGGGAYNFVTNQYGTVCGGWSNISSGVGSFVGGGGTDGTNMGGNQAGGAASVVCGGEGNGSSGNYATVVGGLGNSSSMEYAAIGGGADNWANGYAATVGGGEANLSTATYATISGGSGNLNSAFGAFIGGGGIDTNGPQANIAYPSAMASVIGGGIGNMTHAQYATVGGGDYNDNSGDSSTIGGGFNNYAANFAATVPGGWENDASGAYSFAAGQQAKAINQGAFVWADSQDAPFSSTNDDSFNIRAEGGVFIYDNAGATAGVFLASNGVAWTSISDRNAKKNFQPVDAVGVLDKLAAIPVQQWNYKWENDSDVPNIGPMAQDFKSAFYPGRDDKGITTLEFDGVELAAIQGLNQKLEKQAKEKDAEIESLKQRLDKLERALGALAAGH